MKLELLKGSRSRILAGLILVIAAIFVGRLFYLQIIRHDYYTELARAEQVNQLRIPASRGLIYALNGDKPVPLVLNETVYTVFADPVIVDDRTKVIDVMRRIAGGNLRTGFEALLDRTDSRYQIIATKVTRVQADKIKAEQLHGIGFQAISQRVYPEKSLAAQILGFVNAEGIGNYGIEGKLDDQLKGEDGLLQSVTDVSDVPLTIGNNNVNIPAKDGRDVVLTIDRAVQSRVEQALKRGLKRVNAPEGSVIVMNPNNGQVMAMANYPSYNPAAYYKVTDAADFNNAVISSPYEPGSDIKTFTMATGIDQGAVKPSDTYNNTDYIKVEDRVISNAYKGVTGTISFQTAMNWSLNTGFVTVAQRLGDGREITRSARDTMYQYFHDRLRLGQLTGIELAGEASGLLVSPTTTEGNAVRYSNMSFGQGMDATIVQVAAGFSAIVNGGNYYRPTVVAGYLNEGGGVEAQAPTIPSRVLKESTSQQLRQMTHEARKGVAGSLDRAGYYIGGKTGTSQVIRNGVYSSNETIGSYLGYGGGDRPEYVIMVRVSGQNREFGGLSDALPIFTEISNWLLDYLKVPPKG